MAQPKVIWKGDKALKAAEAAMCFALSFGGFKTQAFIKQELNKHSSGSPAKPTTPSPPGSPPGKLSGDLGRSIQVDRSECRKLIVRVGTNKVYAAIQEFGGRIFAKTANFLRFMVGGSWVTVKSVLLPPRPYMGPVFKKHGKAIQAEIRKRFTQRFNAETKNL